MEALSVLSVQLPKTFRLLLYSQFGLQVLQLILEWNFVNSEGEDVKSNPCIGLDMPWRSQEVEVPRFNDIQHMKVVRLSAVRTGRLYPPGNIPGTHFC